MDRFRRRSAGPLAALVLTATLAGALALAAPGDPPLRGMRWAAAGTNPVRAFATTPSECLTHYGDPARDTAVEVGRAAFRTPLVLGGQAGRAGVACETCHRSGRDNPDFLFPGVSGAPGTADVTSSLFSTHRGNGVFDPKPIPDLSKPKPALTISQTTASGNALEPFIHGLITEEFDGPEPTSATLAGLAAYVRALDPAACPANPRQLVTPVLYMDDARRALRVAQAEAAGQDFATAVVMVASARARLGLIDERFDTPALAPRRLALRVADTRLAAIQATLRAKDLPAAAAAIDAWLQDAVALQADLIVGAPASLFDPARLTAATKRRLPG